MDSVSVDTCLVTFPAPGPPRPSSGPSRGPHSTVSLADRPALPAQGPPLGRLSFPRGPAGAGHPAPTAGGPYPSRGALPSASAGVLLPSLRPLSRVLAVGSHWLSSWALWVHGHGGLCNPPCSQPRRLLPTSAVRATSPESAVEGHLDVREVATSCFRRARRGSLPLPGLTPTPPTATGPSARHGRRRCCWARACCTAPASACPCAPSP